MKEEWIAWLMLLVIGGIGMIFLLSGAAVLALEKRKKGRCIAVTEGKIVKYNHRGQVPQPVVEYQVGGVLFRKTRRFRGVVTIQKSGLLNGFDGEGKVTIDEKDIVHIRRGAFLNWRNLVEAEYPLGKYLKVLYNPQNPKQAYVEKLPPKASLAGTIYCFIGAGLVALAVILFIAPIGITK